MAEEKKDAALEAEKEPQTEKPAEPKKDAEKEKEAEPKKDAAEEQNAGKPADEKEKSEKKPTDASPDEDDDEEGEEELSTDELFKRRPSVDLTPENAHFTRSRGGMVSLTLKGEKGEEFFERVVILRSFPISAPREFLSVRQPDIRKKGQGAELGMIRCLDDFDEETRALIEEELELRYFTPTITKINSIKDKFGYSYWEAETTAGKVSFILSNPFANIRSLEDGRVYITDMDGNSFTIPDPAALDRASYRRIEVYI